MRRLVFSVVAVSCLLLAAPAAAQDDSARLSADCQDDRIDGTYTQQEFRDGLRALPTDVDEYSDCRGTIRRAQLRAAAAAADGSAARVDAAADAGQRASPSKGGVAAARMAGGSAEADAAKVAPSKDGSSRPRAAESAAAPAAATDAGAAGAPAGAGGPGAAGDPDAAGGALTAVGRAAKPTVTPPATAGVLGGLGAALLSGLAAAVWLARRSRQIG